MHTPMTKMFGLLKIVDIIKINIDIIEMKNEMKFKDISSQIKDLQIISQEYFSIESFLIKTQKHFQMLCQK